MPNKEHLEILNKGVEEWNRWREENPEEWPDLREAELDGARLDGARLNRTLLEGAHLRDANLRNADFRDAAQLRGADLRDANLRGAKLTGAVLRDASLRDASLRDAHLQGAVLAGADLRGADLRDADLSDAILAFTVFADVDLRKVKGLESVLHLGPCPVSTSTLERSRGQILPIFLRGCGFSDWEIEAAKLWDPDLEEDERTTIWYEIERIRGQQPWALSRVFVSYTRDDEAFVEALEKRFDEKGVRYWRDVHDLKAGRLERQIDRAITLYPLVLLVLSERSVLSDWVEWEAAKARELERQHLAVGEPRDVLCPVALDEAWKSFAWPGPLRRQIEDYNVLDFSGWEDDEEKMGRQFTKLYEGMVINYGKKGGADAE